MYVYIYICLYIYIGSCAGNSDAFPSFVYRRNWRWRYWIQESCQYVYKSSLLQPYIFLVVAIYRVGCSHIESHVHPNMVSVAAGDLRWRCRIHMYVCMYNYIYPASLSIHTLQPKIDSVAAMCSVSFRGKLLLAILDLGILLLFPYTHLHIYLYHMYVVYNVARRPFCRVIRSHIYKVSCRHTYDLL